MLNNEVIITRECTPFFFFESSITQHFTNNGFSKLTEFFLRTELDF